MEIIDTKIKDVKLIKPKIYGDSRGFFLETYHKDQYKKAGISNHFVQDNHSRSKKNILRGLHYQLDKMQGKLVRVSNGRVYDVAVDMREGSSTFKEYVSFILSDENQYQLYIPPGFAHGFCVISDEADFEYKCTDYYDPLDEHCLFWDDKNINIDLPFKKEDIIVSEKDSKGLLLNELISQGIV